MMRVALCIGFRAGASAAQLDAGIRAALARFGVAGVAEPCAQLAAPQGRLLGPKSIRDGVTVALAGPL
ncbi:cobalamin biosynthesis protein [Burkholderia cepacia]|uniref:cobalamin biosynthesis protein n=1 Tax=Burkholderia cepacia TaxID=292 RepID=UPI003A5C2904